MIDLTKLDIKNYSISRALRVDVARRTGDRSASSLEWEISQEIEKRLAAIHSGYEYRGGLLMPTGIGLGGPQQRAGLDTATAGAGKELAFDEFGSFIDLLRPNSWIITLGATVLSGLKGDVGFPREDQGGVVTWATENPGVDTVQSDLKLGQVWLTPRTAQSTTSFSRQLLAQSTPKVDQVVANDLAKQHAVALDQAALTGVLPAPVGLYNQAITTIDFAGVLSGNYDQVVLMESALYLTNPKREPRPGAALAYLADPVIGAAMKLAPQSATAGGLAMWYEGKVNNRRAEMSVLMPANGLLFGDWSQLMIGEWGVLEIITDPYAKKKRGMIEVTSFLLTDVELAHEAAFAKAGNLTPAAELAAKISKLQAGNAAKDSKADKK